MTKVEYGGGGHRTRLRNDHEDQLVCLKVPPAPVYKGARGEAEAGQGGGAPRGVLLPPGVGLPPFLVGLGEGGKRREREEGKGGRRPPLLVLFGLGGRGRAASLGRPLSSPLWPM